jgi:hypothetical protein
VSAVAVALMAFSSSAMDVVAAGRGVAEATGVTAGRLGAAAAEGGWLATMGVTCRTATGGAAAKPGVGDTCNWVAGTGVAGVTARGEEVGVLPLMVELTICRLSTVVDTKVGCAARASNTPVPASNPAPTAAAAARARPGNATRRKSNRGWRSVTRQARGFGGRREGGRRSTSER